MKKILIVDDSSDIRDLLYEVFSGEFKVLTASKEIEAMNIIKNEKPYITLLDYHLGESVTGIDISKKIKAMNMSIKVYILTASIDTNVFKNEVGGSIDGYFNKEVSPFDLLKKLKEICEVLNG